MTLHDVATMEDGDVSCDALGRWGTTETLADEDCMRLKRFVTPLIDSGVIIYGGHIPIQEQDLLSQ
jgi:hypothetical protein